jgi:serine/threonine protein phosphatase PrpC
MASAAESRSESSHRLLSVCGATDIGAQRPDNQDAFVVADLASGRTTQPCIRTDVSVSRPGVLVVVCDGMGGAPAGDVAARVAAAFIKKDVQIAGSRVVDAPGLTLENAVEGANRAILAEVKRHPEDAGMGTTCTAAVFSTDHLSIAQVGDSRAYLLREGHLQLLTRDQTMVSKLVEAGALKPEDVANHPYRHVLFQALDGGAKVHPVITDLALREGDRVLLCSDGLHGPVDDDVIGAILRAPADVAQAARALITAALAAGGPDNVTVVVADCGAVTGRGTTGASPTAVTLH